MDNQTVTQMDGDTTPVLPDKDQLAFVRVLQDTDAKELEVGLIPHTEVVYEELPIQADIDIYLKYKSWKY